MADTLLKVGRVVGAHGIRGELRVKSFTEDPEDLTAYGPLFDVRGDQSYRLEVRGRVKGALICRMEGVRDRNAAEAIAGLELYVPRAALPDPDEEETYYYSDLIDLEVRDANGVRLGRVKALADHGAGDLLTVEFDAGKEGLFAFTRAIFPQVNLAEGWVMLTPPEVVTSQDETGQVH